MNSKFVLIFLVISWAAAQSEEPPTGLPVLPTGTEGAPEEPENGENAGTVDPEQPQGAAAIRCKQNERYVTCGPWCEPSCENPDPKNCIKRCFIGCQCLPGYYRNKFGWCVKWSECPRPPTCQNYWCPKGYYCKIYNGKPECYPNVPTCQNHWCPPGYHCQIYNNKPECYPNVWVPPGCAALRCNTPGGCALVYPLSCFIGICNPQPTCVNYNACYSKVCPAGQVCVLRQILCVGAPCNHVAECIPTPR